MAGVGKKILSLFVEIEDNPEEKKETPKKTETPMGQATAPQHTSVGSAKISAGKRDEAIAGSLADALEKANMKGFDYFEYAKTLDALKANIPAEQTLFQTAFASGTVMGATKQSLLDSARHYINVLDKEAEKFGASVRQQVVEMVTGKETKLRTVEASIQEKAREIQRLTEEINVMNAEKNSISNEIAENRIKIEKVQNDFTATYRVFLDKIKGDIEKMDKYITG